MIVASLAALVVLQRQENRRPVSPRSLATVIVDGRPLTEPGLIRDRRVQVPMRAVFEALGANVEYTAVNKKIVAQTRRKTISLVVGENFAYLPGKTYLAYPPRIVNGKVYVPLRFVSEALGSLVRWEPENRTAYVETLDREERRGSPEPSAPRRM